MVLTLPCRAWAALTCSTAGRTVLLIAEHVCGTATPAIELRICKLCPMNAICAGTCARRHSLAYFRPNTGVAEKQQASGEREAAERNRRRLCSLHPNHKNFCAKIWCGEEVLAPLAPECRKLFSDPSDRARSCGGRINLEQSHFSHRNDRHTPNLLASRLWNRRCSLIVSPVAACLHIPFIDCNTACNSSHARATRWAANASTASHMPTSFISPHRAWFNALHKLQNESACRAHSSGAVSNRACPSSRCAAAGERVVHPRAQRSPLRPPQHSPPAPRCAHGNSRSAQ